MNLWNIKDLQSPPITTYKSKKPVVDIKTLKQILSEAIDTFKNQKLLKQECALLSRFIYRLKLKFKSDKGMKAMEKMNRSLLQYLRMNILQMLEMFHGMIPRNYTRNTYLPTLNMLHHILVRIQGLSKLLVRVVETAQVSAKCMEMRMQLGHAWQEAFLCFSVISRIFVLTRDLENFCCTFYSRLRPFTAVLENAGLEWLPADYDLPVDLKLWLNVDWLDKNEILVHEAKKSNVLSIFDIVDSDSDVEISGEYTQIKDDIEVTDEYVIVKENDSIIECKKNKSSATVLDVGKMLAVEDIGEVVNLKNEPDLHNNKKKVKRGKRKLGGDSVQVLISNIKTLQDLQEFERNFENHSKAFRGMNKLKCKMLRKTIKKCIIKARKHNSDHVKVDMFVGNAKKELTSKLG